MAGLKSEFDRRNCKIIGLSVDGVISLTFLSAPMRNTVRTVALSTAVLLASSPETSTEDESGWRDHGAGPGSTEGDYIDWLTISDNAQSVVADVRRIREQPLVPGRIPIFGTIYDCKSGRLIEILEAAEAGKAS